MHMPLFQIAIMMEIMNINYLDKKTTNFPPLKRINITQQNKKRKGKGKWAFTFKSSIKRDISKDM